ncbi:protein translocase subunit SecF [Pararhodospirillum photometricum]|uniref:Protein-export membrane protein SecF n=1 Tax=Pararhodospirillum photometricum DSM 122 TaxID=1150469 RepID=H6SQ51_PARPM|nr:protein translocase subunit SecF [Pararhodospirillum photometricum]CCG09570.1 Preprotein translocase subunit SecF [Pararhodospirillum photometricum DSM 122]
MLRPVRFLPDNTAFDFISKRVWFISASGVFLLGCLLSVAVQGLNFGIDFTGGILVEARTPASVDLAQVRETLNTQVAGDIALTTYGSEGRDLMIRVPEQPGGEAANNAALTRLKGALGDGVEYRRTEVVGPKVGDELVTAGALAMGLAILSIAGYIWFRFEWQYAIGGVIALLHDVIATIGLFSLFQVQFDLTSVAAVMTVAGYSINDTVVIFDRVREELRRHKKMGMGEVLNLAINRTLSRTILTGGTTLLALLCLFLFGGEVLRGFSIAIIWGIVVGTYSSIYVAVPALIYFRFERSGEGDAPVPVEEKEGLGKEASGADLAARAAQAEAEARRAMPSRRVTGKVKPRR